MYELTIIGGGPAGVAAGVYAGRKKMKTAIVTDMFGGQSVVSNEIQNFIGYVAISGVELAGKMEEQLRAQEIDVMDGDRVARVEDKGDFLLITTEGGKSIESKFVLMTSGSARRKLGVPGEKEFDGKGVAYCATCDAPLFKDKRVIVVGGGNAGLESVVDLIPYASEIFLFEYKDTVKGDAVTLERIQKESKVKIFTHTQLLEIKGDTFVRSVKYKDIKTNEEKEMDVDGVFVEIGWIPNSRLVKELVSVNELGEIVVDHKTQKTSHPRIWAAGDVADVLYKQNNISMGDAVKAVLNIYEHLQKSGN
jgi:alkyl hydroperoxide reductase subunit F